MEKNLQRLAEQMKREAPERQFLPDISLKDIFEDYDKDDIVEMAETKGLKNLSRCRREIV